MAELTVEIELRDSSTTDYRAAFACPGRSLQWSADTDYDSLELIYKDMKKNYPDLCKGFPRKSFKFFGKPDIRKEIQAMEKWLVLVLQREHYRYFTGALKAMLGRALSDAARPETHLDAVVLGKGPEGPPEGPLEAPAIAADGSVPVSVSDVASGMAEVIDERLVETAGRVVVEAVIPGLLELAGKVPLLGGIVSSLGKFYGLCKQYTELSAGLKDLISDMNYTSGILKDSMDLFRHGYISDGATRGLDRLVETVQEANAFAVHFHKRSKGINLVIASSLDEEMKRIRATLLERNRDFKTDLSAYRLVMEQQELVRRLLDFPPVFTSDILTHEANFQDGSRQWMFELVYDWLNDAAASKVFWIKGDAGMGKSAFAAALVKRLQREGRCLGAFFGRYSDATRNSPSALVRSLAAQCALQLPELQTEMLAAFQKPRLHDTDVTTLFDELLVAPLGLFNPPAVGRKEMIFVIDALDETGETSEARKALLSLLANKAKDLPSWLKVLVTSRPEPDIVNALKRYTPTEILETDPRHLEDLIAFVRMKLSPLMSEEELPQALALCADRSEGRFVYIATVMEDLLKRNPSRLSIEDLDWELPEGLDGSYRVFFTRMRRKNEAFYDTCTVKLLQLIVAAREPLLASLAAKVLGCSAGVNDLKFRQSVNQLRAMFPLREMSSGEAAFMSFHKSVVDWLCDESRSGGYDVLSDVSRDNFYIDSKAGDLLFAPYLWDAVKPLASEQRDAKVDVGLYEIKFGLYHWSLGGKHDDVVSLCFQLRFLQCIFNECAAAEAIGSLLWLCGQATSRSEKSIAESLNLLVKLMRLSLPGLLKGETMNAALVYQIMGRLQTDQLARYPPLKHLHAQAEQWQPVAGEVCLKPVRASLTAPGGVNELILSFPQFVRCVLLLPDGRLACAAASSVFIYSADGTVCEHILKHSENDIFMTVASVCALAGDRIVSAAYDAIVKLWDSVTGECLNMLEGHTEWVNAVCALSGDRIVSGSRDHTLRVWDAGTGECVRVLAGHTESITTVCALSGDRIVSGSWDATLRVWDAGTGECVRILEGHTEWINEICALSHNRIVSGSTDCTLRIWDAGTGECVRILNGHQKACCAVSALPGDRIVSGSEDKTIRIWDLATGACVRVIEGHTNGVDAVCGLPGDRILSGSYDNSLRVWGAESDEGAKPMEGHTESVTALCALPDDRVVSASVDHTLRVWDAGTGECVRVLTGHSAIVSAVCALSGDRIVSGSWDATLRVWDAGTGECVRILEGHTESVKTICVAAGDHIVSGSGEGVIRLWTAATGACLGSMQGHLYSVDIVCCLSEDLFGSSGGDCTVRIWNIRTGECVRTLEGHTLPALGISLLPDGRLLSTAFDDTVRIWNATTGECEINMNAESPQGKKYRQLLLDGPEIIEAGVETPFVDGDVYLRCLTGSYAVFPNQQKVHIAKLCRA